MSIEGDFQIAKALQLRDEILRTLKTPSSVLPIKDVRLPFLNFQGDVEMSYAGELIPAIEQFSGLTKLSESNISAKYTQYGTSNSMNVTNIFLPTIFRNNPDRNQDQREISNPKLNRIIGQIPRDYKQDNVIENVFTESIEKITQVFDSLKKNDTIVFKDFDISYILNIDKKGIKKKWPIIEYRIKELVKKEPDSVTIQTCSSIEIFSNERKLEHDGLADFKRCMLQLKSNTYVLSLLADIVRYKLLTRTPLQWTFDEICEQSGVTPVLTIIGKFSDDNDVKYRILQEIIEEMIQPTVSHYFLNTIAECSKLLRAVILDESQYLKLAEYSNNLKSIIPSVSTEASLTGIIYVIVRSILNSSASDSRFFTPHRYNIDKPEKNKVEEKNSTNSQENRVEENEEEEKGENNSQENIESENKIPPEFNKGEGLHFIHIYTSKWRSDIEFYFACANILELVENKLLLDLQNVNTAFFQLLVSFLPEIINQLKIGKTVCLLLHLTSKIPNKKPTDIKLQELQTAFIKISPLNPESKNKIHPHESTFYWNNGSIEASGTTLFFMKSTKESELQFFKVLDELWKKSKADDLKTSESSQDENQKPSSSQNKKRKTLDSTDSDGGDNNQELPISQTVKRSKTENSKTPESSQDENQKPSSSQNKKRKTLDSTDSDGGDNNQELPISQTVKRSKTGNATSKKCKETDPNNIIRDRELKLRTRVVKYSK